MYKKTEKITSSSYWKARKLSKTAGLCQNITRANLKRSRKDRVYINKYSPFLHEVCIHVCMLSHFYHVLSLCSPTDCSPPGSSVHGILQARMLEWVAVPSRGSSQTRDKTCISWIAGRFLTAEPPRKPLHEVHFKVTKQLKRSFFLELF